ncbi:hypothetical protein Bbelb_445190 [Branchiostoma belcheri]|nr:hypothetical protein Bbelb_445190 [Branchiostoma belcheri]
MSCFRRKCLDPGMLKPLSHIQRLPMTFLPITPKPSSVLGWEGERVLFWKREPFHTSLITEETASARPLSPGWPGVSQTAADSSYKTTTSFLSLWIRPYAILNAESQQNSQPKRKRTWSRAVFSNLQRKGLEKRFDIQKYVTKPDRKQLASMLGLTDAQFSRHARSHRQSHGHGRPLKPPSDNQPQTRFTQQYKTPNQHDSERGLKTMREGLVPEPADEVEKRHEGEGAAGAGEECLDDDEDSPDTSVEHVNPDCAASGAGKTEQTTSHPELNGPADVPYGQ